MAKRYITGDPVVLTNTFLVAGTETDPTTVALAVTDPDGTTTTYTYAAAEITKTSVGIYTKTITVDDDGMWTYKWTGTGPAADIADGTFQVFAASDGTLYAPLGLVKEQQGIGDTVDDVNIQVAVDAAKQAIDEWCGRFFHRQTATRYFDPPPAWWPLQVGDLVEVTTLKTDDDNDDVYEHTWTTSDYLLSPYNAASDAKPYTQIAVRSGGDFSWPSYPKSIELVGTFGWPSVPAAVRQAAAIQAGVFFKRATEGATPIVTMDGQVLAGGSRYLDRSVELLLAPYRIVAVA